MFIRFTVFARNVLQAKEGAVAIQMALTMVVLIGMGALTIDVGYALYVQRHMQAAADASAFSAAIAKSTGHPATLSTEALAVAGASGFVNGSNGVVVTFNPQPVSPPATAADAANASAVQVIITQSLSLPLISAVCPLLPGGGCSGAFTVAAQAVATAATASTSAACDPITNPSAQCTCALQLSPAATPSAGAITIGNGANIQLTQCGIQACSTATPALTVNGGAQVSLVNQQGTPYVYSNGATNLQTVAVAGGATINNGGGINGVQNTCSGLCQTKACAPNADPYAAQIASLVLPPGGCSLGTGQNYAWAAGNPAYTFNPGVWCGGVTFGQGLTYKLNPGVYYVNGGTFGLGGGATLTGTGVTIVLTGSGANFANVNVGGGGTLNLTAPTSGTTSGIAFLGDPNAPLSNANTFQGGSQNNVTGAEYFPSQTVVFNNGTTTNSSGCTQIVGGALQFQGGMTFKGDCAGTGTSNLGGGGSGGANALVE